MTQRLDKIYGVNHDLINSIAHRTNRRVRALSGGMQVVEPVMANAPKNDQEVDLVRQIVHTSRNLYGVIVSLDEKAALITATFIEGRLNHRRLFDEISRSIVEPYEDENTRIYVAGEPRKIQAGCITMREACHLPGFASDRKSACSHPHTAPRSSGRSRQTGAVVQPTLDERGGNQGGFFIQRNDHPIEIT